MVASRWQSSLILTLTRRCDLRCTYCPTVKTGLPDLSIPDALKALTLFTERFGGGDCKLFGGEPALVPDTVEAVIQNAPATVSVYLSSNGRQLGDRLLKVLRDYPATTMTITLDGPPDVHNRLRRAEGGGQGDSHQKILEKLPDLLSLPRFVVTQTIAPTMAQHAATSFDYLLSLGIQRFNLLPGYYLPWKPEELLALQAAFTKIRARIEAEWQLGHYLYLRNLFIKAPTPFFNTGMVVDVDRRIHPSNVILARRFDELREESALGTLDSPPDMQTLLKGASQTSTRLKQQLGPAILSATRSVDSLLTGLCNQLYPAFFAWRQHRQKRQQASL